jgi:hypothetical protein
MISTFNAACCRHCSYLGHFHAWTVYLIIIQIAQAIPHMLHAGGAREPCAL